MSNCLNRSRGYADWICLCPSPGTDIRSYVAGLFNGWLSADALRRARTLAESASTTNEQLAELLKQLERDANQAYGFWQMGN